MLEACDTQNPLFPPTELYNEGWLLRIFLDWFSKQNIQKHPFAFLDDAKWYSEALLPSTFLPRSRKDPLGESWTHADGAIGHFIIGKAGRGDLTLSNDAKQFIIIEAKMFSKLSQGVTHAKYFDQAARTVSCIAEALKRAKLKPHKLSRLCFFLVAPQSQIDMGIFEAPMNTESIMSKVRRRVSEYKGAKDRWFKNWFQPTFEYIKTKCISWEELLSDVSRIDSTASMDVSVFYERCLLFNSKQPIKTHD